MILLFFLGLGFGFLGGYAMRASRVPSTLPHPSLQSLPQGSQHDLRFALGLYGVQGPRPTTPSLGAFSTHLRGGDA